MIRPEALRLAGIAAAALLILAGHAGEARAALSWDLSLGGGALRDDNLHLDPEAGVEGARAPVGETVYAGAAEITLEWSGRHDRLAGSYRGEHWAFTGDEDLDPLWLHTLAADLGWRRWSPFFLDVRAERGRIPRSQEREGEAVVDQVDRSLVSGRTGLSWEIGPRGVVELAYRGEVEDFSGADDLDQVQGQFGEGLVRYRWSPLVESELRAGYGWVERRLAPDYTEASVAAHVVQRLSERLQLSYGLEWIRDEEEARPAGDGEAPAEPGQTVRSSLLKSAELRWEAAEIGAWRLGYEDRIEARPDGDTLRTGRASAGLSRRARLGSTIEAGGWYEERRYRVSGREDQAWGPTVSARWMVAPWAACDLGGGWTSTTVREAGLPELEDRRVDVTAGAIAVLAGHLTVEFGYRFQQNDSSAALRSYTGNQFSAWVTYHLRPIPPGSVPRTVGAVASGR